MATIAIDKSEIKNLVKEALEDILSNRMEIIELFEDIAFGKMIDEGLNTPSVSKKEVMKALGVKR